MTLPAPEIENLPPDHLLRQPMEAIVAHPEVREPLLRVLLTEDFLALPKRVDKLQSELEEFREETRAGFRAVNERIDATNTEVRTLRGEVRTLSDRVDENTRATRRLGSHVGGLIGNSYEDRCRYEIGVILDGWLNGPVLADRDLISARLFEARQSGVINREEYLDGLRPDIIAREARDTGHDGVLAVVEVSLTFNRKDLENAARRAAIISQVAGISVASFVATHGSWPDEVNATAQSLGVTIILHEDPDYEFL